MKILDRTLVKIFRKMLLIRRVQEKIAEIFPKEPRKIKCPVHLYTGQEAIAASISSCLSLGDIVFGDYRCHGYYLAMGGSVRALLAELYGKIGGCARGWGGSMHLVDAERGFMGASAIVGGSIPLAVGSALAFKIRGEKRISVAVFGDGAIEEGVWHESMNFASLKKLPVIFVCENNFYAVKSPLLSRRSLDNIYRMAENYGMFGIRVDGNNAEKMLKVAEKAIDNARKGFGPTLIEARTYRWRQHCENTFFDQNILEGRPKKEHDKWLMRCPIKFLEKKLTKERILNKSDIEKMILEIDKETEEAVRFAEKSPFPKKLSNEK